MPKAAIRGVAFGILIMSFFGALWASIGLGGTLDWNFPLLLGLIIIVSLLLLAGGISLLKTSQKLTDEVTETDAKHWKRARRWFGIIFGIEGLLIGVASATLGGQQINLWWTVVGFGSAVVLWGTGFAIWLQVKRC